MAVASAIDFTGFYAIYSGLRGEEGAFNRKVLTGEH